MHHMCDRRTYGASRSHLFIIINILFISCTTTLQRPAVVHRPLAFTCFPHTVHVYLSYYLKRYSGGCGESAQGTLDDDGVYRKIARRRIIFFWSKEGGSIGVGDEKLGKGGEEGEQGWHW